MIFRKLLPAPLKALLRPLIIRLDTGSHLKHAAELEYWQSCFSAEGTLGNALYQELMLKIAGERDGEFLRDKIVADFGCGPRGSLCWAETARLRIGIDVLADLYGKFNIRAHPVCYICSTETSIPLPSNYVDVLYTVNALDHVSRLPVMCRELVRIMAPGGELIASLNLDHPQTLEEPQPLTEKKLRTHLLHHFNIVSYRLAPKVEGFEYFDMPKSEQRKIDPWEPKYLWVRARKKS